MKNAYEVRGDTAIIIVDSKRWGRVQVFIDATDIQKVQAVKWVHVSKRREPVGFYAHVGLGNRRFYLHRFLLNPPQHLEVDHIDHRGLNNRRSNLRTVTPSKNHLNRSGLDSHNTSGHTGVSWHHEARKWRAYIQIGGRFNHLGYYADKAEASRVAIQARREAING